MKPVACLAVLFCLAGCSARTRQVDLRGLAFPVLVGPVECVGGAPGGIRSGRRIASVDAKSSTLFAAGSGSSTQHAYGDVYTTTHTSSVGRESQDTIAVELLQETQGLPDRVVTLDEIKATNSTHLSIFALQSMTISIKGEVWDPE